MTKGGIDSLAAALRDENVSEPDIDDLKSAIEEDASAVDHSQKQFGPKVKAWMKSMLAKAVDATWKVNLGAAGNLLATALKKYYGWD